MPRKAQLRTSATLLRGGPKAPTGQPLDGRVLLARRKLGETGWVGEVNFWGPELLEVRIYTFGRGSTAQTLVMPAFMLGELAGFMHSVVESMARSGHRVVDAHLVELVPARVFPGGGLLVAHGVRAEDGGPPVGMSIALYQLEGDGQTLRPMLVEGRPQLLGMHRAGCPALASLFAEAVAAAAPSAGSA